MDLISHEANGRTNDDSSLATEEWRNGEAHASFVGTSWLNNKAIFPFQGGSYHVHLPRMKGHNTKLLGCYPDDHRPLFFWDASI